MQPTANLLLRCPEDAWKDEDAAGLDEAQLLRYRSNLLGSDLAITNFGGGNTSAKIAVADPLTGHAVDVLWVKGSGGDLGSMDLSGFATLYMDRLLSLEGRYRGLEHEDEMVELLDHCIFGRNSRAPSIDTPLHGFLPFRHIDHLHPDAVIAIAAAANGEAVVRELWGETMGWLPWQRPGFDLGLKLRDLVATKSNMRGVVLGGHGLFTWGEDARSCYRNSIAAIAEATDFLNLKLAERRPFGGQVGRTVAKADAASWMVQARAILSDGSTPKIGHFDQSAEVMEFVGSERLDDLAALGTSCPDHFLRTKIAPLVVRDPATLTEAVATYRENYAAYHAEHARTDSPPVRDGNPVVLLVPSLGMMTFAADKATARIAGEFYRNAINVMRGAEVLGGYSALPRSEAFAIEYWSLEEAKLNRLPPRRPLAGKVALVTGAGGAIGRAIAKRLAREGAALVLTDINEEVLQQSREALVAAASSDQVRAIVTDVTDQVRIAEAFDFAAREYGGVDLLVANAGIASAASVSETSIELWRHNMSVLVEGYFLSARAAFAQMKLSGGGSIVFIGSKNGLAASPGAVAYSTAKAAELHLARGLALEGAAHGIRVNSVNPDAVLKGSRIWDGEWRRERAEAYGIAPEQLEAHYRDRSLLKREVLPEDVAEAAYFFLSEASAKSTGNILNVDAGHAGAFPR